MANEISISASLSVSKNGASASGSGSKTLDLAGTELISLVQSFGTSEAAITLGGLDSVGQLFIKNLDATNTLTVGFADPIVTVLSVIQPGAEILVSGVSTTLYAKSGASTVEAFIVATEA